MNAPTGQVARFDPSAISDLAPATSGAQTAVWVPQSFGDLMEVAKLMSQSGVAIPKHLRNSPGMCLSVAMVAYNNGFNPYLLAADSYVVNDVLAYGAKAIAAMVNNSPRMTTRLHYELSGAWPKRVCTVSAKIRGDERPKVLDVNAETIKTRNSPLWTQQPDQQLIYYAGRAWARVYMPEVLMGLLDRDEADEIGPDNARDVTPPRPTRSAASSAQATDDGGAAEPPKPTLEFVDTQGEFIAYAGLADYADAFIVEMRRAPREVDVQGIWETNSQTLDSLRAIGAEGEKLAEEIHAAYREELDAKKKAEHKSAAASEPAQAEPETPAEQPINDGQALYDELVTEIASRISARDLHDWFDARAEHLKTLKNASPALHKDLIGRAEKRQRDLAKK